ncbi:SDR family NAD(P)-dependent oxidoreductase [Nocardia xishanensis]
MNAPIAAVHRTVLDRFRLDGRVVVVTGASSGLGVAFAAACAEAGADVVLAARRVDKLHETARLVEAAGRRALTIATDVSDPQQCARMVDAAMEEFGRVDVLVNNAGVSTAVPVSRETPDEFRRVVYINLLGSYWAAQACGRVMQPGSAIVNITSVLAMMSLGLPQAAYSASKSAVLGLTRDLAQQWGSRRGIRVNALAPGFFESEMTAKYADGYIETLTDRIILGRQGNAHELADALIWLISDAGTYVTGQTIVVDGGISIT